MPLLGIGRLARLEVVQPGAKDNPPRVIKPRNVWLAWDTGRRAFCIGRLVRKAKGAKVPSALAKRHAKFHNAEPSGMSVLDVPNPGRGLKMVGLLKALVYTVPKHIRSPEKNRYIWHHAFGDTGHKGGDYPESVMPALKTDGKNWFIVRRPGNIFNVDEWLRG